MYFLIIIPYYHSDVFRVLKCSLLLLFILVTCDFVIFNYFLPERLIKREREMEGEEEEEEESESEREGREGKRRGESSTSTLSRADTARRKIDVTW